MKYVMDLPFYSENIDEITYSKNSIRFEQNQTYAIVFSNFRFKLI